MFSTLETGQTPTRSLEYNIIRARAAWPPKLSVAKITLLGLYRGDGGAFITFVGLDTQFACRVVFSETGTSTKVPSCLGQTGGKYWYTFEFVPRPALPCPAPLEGEHKGGG